MIQEFTDNEYAVMYDSLAEMRNKIRAEAKRLNREPVTPNIDRAIEKMCRWGSPAGCGFLAVSGDDAEAIKGAAA